MTTIIVLIVIFFVLRLATLIYSIKNEKRILKQGAVQYGKKNSMFMTVLHVLYYISAPLEAYITNTSFGTTGIVGVVLFSFSYIMLLYVIYQLKDVWTVKLYIVNNHKVNNTFLFKYIRHPNYFLNIIPELIGIGMLCNAWYTMMIILPLYLITLVLRIAEEERVMKTLKQA